MEASLFANIASTDVGIDPATSSHSSLLSLPFLSVFSILFTPRFAATGPFGISARLHAVLHLLFTIVMSTHSFTKLIGTKLTSIFLSQALKTWLGLSAAENYERVCRRRCHRSSGSSRSRHHLTLFSLLSYHPLTKCGAGIQKVLSLRAGLVDRSEHQFILLHQAQPRCVRPSYLIT